MTTTTGPNGTVRHAQAADGEVALSVRGLVKEYRDRSGHEFRAVDDVSFDLQKGRSLALVGESGSGKSTTSRCILRLIEPEAGEVRFGDIDVMQASRQQLRALRRKAQLIFQDPYSALDPRLRVGDAIAEGLDIHRVITGSDRKAKRARRVEELLELVGLEAEHARRLPKDFSGGQRQRIGIARALALDPELLVCDEPIASLDVSIQAQVLNLLADLSEQLDLTVLFIAHDLATVRFLCDDIAVMQRGRICEIGPTESVLSNPSHSYTQELLAAVPLPEPAAERQRRRERIAAAETQHSNV